jgi:hypothetical protein
MECWSRVKDRIHDSSFAGDLDKPSVRNPVSCRWIDHGLSYGQMRHFRKSSRLRTCRPYPSWIVLRLGLCKSTASVIGSLLFERKWEFFGCLEEAKDSSVPWSILDRLRQDYCHCVAHELLDYAMRLICIGMACGSNVRSQSDLMKSPHHIRNPPVWFDV